MLGDLPRRRERDAVDALRGRLGGADLGRAGTCGVLFRDVNGNGVRDRLEPGPPGMRVTVGGWPAIQTPRGGSRWRLTPTGPLQADVDTLSFSDPHFLLPAPVTQVRPGPNAFGAISLSVAGGGEVGDFVVLRERGLGGVPVILRDLNTGTEGTFVTFADGGFYRGAVPPGPGDKPSEDLELRLEPRQ
jgi:hypothetical protein